MQQTSVRIGEFDDAPEIRGGGLCRRGKNLQVAAGVDQLADDDVLQP